MTLHHFQLKKIFSGITEFVKVTLTPGILSCVSLSSSLQHHQGYQSIFSGPFRVCVGVGPVPGLEVAP